MVERRIENFSSKVLRIGSLVGGCQGTSGEVGCSSSGKTTTSRKKRRGNFHHRASSVEGRGVFAPPQAASYRSDGTEPITIVRVDPSLVLLEHRHSRLTTDRLQGLV